MAATAIDSKLMVATARDVLGLDKKMNETLEDETFRSFFGASISIITELWNLLIPTLIGKVGYKGAEPMHLLWALVHIKVYSTEAVHCRIVGWPDKKTYRKWTWHMLRKISDLKEKVMRLDDRFEGWDGTTSCLMSIDGIDCMVNEPWPFDEKWYSQKFNGPGVKYEVGVCINSGRIVWVNGPFVASTSDVTMFKETLVHLLTDDEGVEDDAGYKGHDKLKGPTVATTSVGRKMKSQVRGRHENVNSRLKIFNVLNIPFRHTNPRDKMMEKHGYCFNAIAVITELKFQNGDSLIYDVNYDVTYD